MDFILEWIVGFILEIIIEGSKASWIPKPLRIFLFILFLGVYLALIGLFICVAVVVNNIIEKIIFAGFAIVFIVCLAKKVLNRLL